MPVRKTESRIPLGLQPADLGEAVLTGDNRCALIATLSSPIVANRENAYVLMVTDAALAAAVTSFEWTFAINDVTDGPVVTAEGETNYVPPLPGRLEVSVRMLDSGGATLAALTMTQAVQPLNRQLELRILFESPAPGTTLGNLDVARELVNDFSPYLDQLTPPAGEDVIVYRDLIYGFVRNGALYRSPADRKTRLQLLAEALNGDGFDLPSLLEESFGVCAIRLPLLAMMAQSGGGVAPLAFRELPEEQPRLSAALRTLARDCSDLGANTLIDLFNQVRFPKQNILRCAEILVNLRDRYFPGTAFVDVMTGFEGTRIHWLLKHFRIGPVQRG